LFCFFGGRFSFLRGSDCFFVGGASVDGGIEDEIAGGFAGGFDGIDAEIDDGGADNWAGNGADWED